MLVELGMVGEETVEGDALRCWLRWLGWNRPQPNIDGPSGTGGGGWNADGDGNAGGVGNGDIGGNGGGSLKRGGNGRGGRVGGDLGIGGVD